MKIGGRGLREHLQLLAPLFGFIAAVWVLRMVVYALGASPMMLHIVSVTVAGRISILLAVVMIHRRRFGGYTNVVAAVFLLICWEEFLIIAAIIFSILTGINNVYGAPQFSGGQSPWVNVAGHLTIGLGSGALFGAAMGCVLLWMLRKVDPTADKHKAVGSRH
ncbi:MAG TPA: hypothetical protein VI455_18455 [Terriglobia bacterium]